MDEDIGHLLSTLNSQLDILETSLRPLLNPPPTQNQNLPLLDTAKQHVLQVYSLYTLIFSTLKLSQVDAQSHPVYKEIARVKTYFAKIKAAEEAGAGSQTLPPRARLDRDAARRFVGHGIGGYRGRRERLDGEDKTEDDTDTATVQKRVDERQAAQAAQEQEERNQRRSRKRKGFLASFEQEQAQQAQHQSLPKRSRVEQDLEPLPGRPDPLLSQLQHERLTSLAAKPATASSPQHQEPAQVPPKSSLDTNQPVVPSEPSTKGEKRRQSAKEPNVDPREATVVSFQEPGFEVQDQSQYSNDLPQETASGSQPSQTPRKPLHGQYRDSDFPPAPATFDSRQYPAYPGAPPRESYSRPTPTHNPDGTPLTSKEIPRYHQHEKRLRGSWLEEEQRFRRQQPALNVHHEHQNQNQNQNQNLDTDSASSSGADSDSQGEDEAQPTSQNGKSSGAQKRKAKRKAREHLKKDRAKTQAQQSQNQNPTHDQAQFEEQKWLEKNELKRVRRQKKKERRKSNKPPRAAGEVMRDLIAKGGQKREA